MSNKRSTAARKKTLRDRRREGFAAARENWSDQGFGIELSKGRADRAVVKWTIDHDPFMALMGYNRLRMLLDGVEQELVAKCRFEVGLSWDEIGWARDVSGEAIRKRLGAAVEERDPWQGDSP